MGLPDWEAFLENHIEGFFNRKFSSELEPAEVQKALEHELLRKRKKSSRGDYVPNVYEILLNMEDYQRLSSRRFVEDLTAALERLLISADVYMDGTLSIRINNSEDVEKNICKVSSGYEDDVNEKDASLDFGTLVLDKKSFSVPLNLPPVRLLTSLTVEQGGDEGGYLEFGEKKIYIGRRSENEFLLTDPNASRLHAYIEYERHRHVLHDAKSLNGTFLNGKQIESSVLQPGDKIRIGNTVLCYEVLE